MLTKDFVTAGRAVLTVQDGDHWQTYRVRFKEGEGNFRDTYFVNVLTNGDQYQYVGMLDAKTGACRPTRASNFSTDSDVVRLFNRGMAQVWGIRDHGLTIRHEGKCGKCGRALTHPDSLDSGIGPECARRANRAKAPARETVEVPSQGVTRQIAQKVAQEKMRANLADSNGPVATSAAVKMASFRAEYIKQLQGLFCSLREELRSLQGSGKLGDGAKRQDTAIALGMVQQNILLLGGELP